jgi:hypothetical protein
LNTAGSTVHSYTAGSTVHNLIGNRTQLDWISVRACLDVTEMDIGFMVVERKKYNNVYNQTEKEKNRTNTEMKPERNVMKQ